MSAGSTSRFHAAWERYAARERELQRMTKAELVALVLSLENPIDAGEGPAIDFDAIIADPAAFLA